MGTQGCVSVQVCGHADKQVHRCAVTRGAGIWGCGCVGTQAYRDRGKM